MLLAENVVVATKFRLVRELGKGGMGSVWLAHHEELDIPCAVKFIEGESVNSAEMRERFVREARAAAQLRSPHVVQILDQGTWENTPYIAMELLDGEDLGQRLKRLSRLTGAQTVAILGQVARALSKAHSLGIVHRDLKPDNIFLVRDDDRELVKILDFGIAKMNANALDLSSGTRTGTLMGTPFYMSPEQAQGTKAVDARSDVWAIGVIAFECLTGIRPFESSALGDLLLQICAHPLPSIVEAAPDLPPAVEDWWRIASTRNPDERFQSAKDLVDALAVALGLAPAADGALPLSNGTPLPVSPSRIAHASTGARTVSPISVDSEIIRPRRSPALLIGGVAAALLIAVGSFAGLSAMSKGSGAVSAAAQPTAPRAATSAAPLAPAAASTAVPAVAPVASSAAPAASTAPTAPAPTAPVARTEPKPEIKATKAPPVVKADPPPRVPAPIKDEVGF